MEDLAVVGGVGVVSVVPALAGEGEAEGGVQEEVGVHGEEVALVGGGAVLGKDDGGGQDRDGGGQLEKHSEVGFVVFVLQMEDE